MEEKGPENNYECDASSSVYGMEGSDAEPMGFENNGLLWLPPKPEEKKSEPRLLQVGALQDKKGNERKVRGQGNQQQGRHFSITYSTPLQMHTQRWPSSYGKHYMHEERKERGKCWLLHQRRLWLGVTPVRRGDTIRT